MSEPALEVLTTALEGGVGYWAVASGLRRDSEGNVERVILEDANASTAADADFTPKTVDARVVIRGLRTLARPAMLRALGELEEAPPRGSLALKCAKLLLGDEDVTGDIDAGDADDIVQVGLFGEVVYG